MASGQCLCGAVRFSLKVEPRFFYRCHCSLCRKASGSNGNSILIVPLDRFRWVRGEDHGVTFAVRPTYSITRCKTCGTPLPAETDAHNVYVTAGTQDAPLGRGVRTHLFCASKADWDRDEAGVRHFDERSS